MSPSGSARSGRTWQRLRHVRDGRAWRHAPGAADALTRAGGDPFGPLLGSALVTAWQLDAVAVAVLVLAAAAYLTGVALVPLPLRRRRWPVRRTAAFLGRARACCVFATNGSIAVYDQVLFSAHMIGHLALVMVAPALLGGRPPADPGAGRVAAAAPRAAARGSRTGRVVSLLTAPPVALAAYTVVIVGSHLTGLMDTIMRNTWAGQVEHLVYLLAGCQFFVLVVGDEPIRWRLGSPARWLLLAVAMAVDTFTGIVLLQGTHAVRHGPRPARCPSTRCPTPAPAARSCGSAATRSWSCHDRAGDRLAAPGRHRRRRPQGLAGAGAGRRRSPSTPPARATWTTYDEDDAARDGLQRVAGRACDRAADRPRAQPSRPMENVASRSWRE